MQGGHRHCDWYAHAPALGPLAFLDVAAAAEEVVGRRRVPRPVCVAAVLLFAPRRRRMGYRCAAFPDCVHLELASKFGAQKGQWTCPLPLSFQNQGEAALVAAIVRHLVRGCGVPAAEIGVPLPLLFWC